MKIGVVGLPNVGKSSLFNAITNASVIPSFSSNRILERYGHTSGKIDIPILNNEAYTNYYSVCKKK